jgi:hypothetical protein
MLKVYHKQKPFQLVCCEDEEKVDLKFAITDTGIGIAGQIRIYF